MTFLKKNTATEDDPKQTMTGTVLKVLASPFVCLEFIIAVTVTAPVVLASYVAFAVRRRRGRIVYS